MSVIVKGGGGGKSSGLYVWKKYDKCPQVTISFSGTIGSTEPVKVTVSSSQIDVSTLTESFFTGLSGKCSNKNGTFDFSFPSDGVISINNSSNNFVYNQSTHQIEIDGTPYITSFDDVIKEQESTFLDFVVSDDPTAYPDGGEQGGYWYERGLGIDLSALGCTKAVTEKITPSSRTSKIYHSLGITPKIVIVTTESTAVGRYDTQGFIVAPFSLKTSAKELLLGGTYNNYSGSGDISNHSVSSLTSEYIDIGEYFTAGVEYIVTTIG